MHLSTGARPVHTDHPWQNRSQPHVVSVLRVVLSIDQLVRCAHVALYVVQNIHAVGMSGDV